MAETKELTIQRANVILSIPEAQLDYYMNQGYNVIDKASGKVIMQSVPNDLGTLRKAYVDHIEEIKQLKAQIAEMQVDKDAEAVTTRKRRKTE